MFEVRLHLLCFWTAEDWLFPSLTPVRGTSAMLLFFSSWCTRRQ
jgi:hypothetical protein